MKKSECVTLIFRGFKLDEDRLVRHLYRCFTDQPMGRLRKTASNDFAVEEYLLRGWWSLYPHKPGADQLHKLWDAVPLASGFATEKLAHETVFYPVSSQEEMLKFTAGLRRGSRVTISYKGFSKQGTLSSKHPWGIRLKTTEGFRNFTWANILLQNKTLDSPEVTVILANGVNGLGFGTLKFWVPTESGLRPDKSVPYDSRLSYRIVVAGSKMIYGGVAGD